MILTHLLSLFIIVVVEHCDIQIVHFRNKKSTNAGKKSICLKYVNKSSNAYSSSHSSYSYVFIHLGKWYLLGIIKFS